MLRYRSRFSGTPGHLERFLEVYDTRAWHDGIDYVYGVEHLQFHNMIVDTASVMDPLFHL